MDSQHEAAWDKAQADLYASGLTDGLPVVPPTQERIDCMLKFSKGASGDVLGLVPPAFEGATWEKIAFNAVLAGCRPEYLPIVAAAMEAMLADEFNLLGITTTTGSAATLILVNGPITREMGMNASAGCLGPGSHANATIGRAVRLALRNIGKAIPGETDMATLGQPAKFTFCFSENEQSSPWEPFHVERGFEAHANVATVIGTSGILEVLDTASATPADLAQTYAQSALIAGNVSAAGFIGSGESLMIIPPEHAQIFHKNGYSKQDVKAAIYERAQLSIDRLSPAVRKQLREPQEAFLRISRTVRDLLIVVAGGGGVKAAHVPTWAGSTKAVSRMVQ